MADQVLDFDEIFNAYMAQNQKVWKHDRALTVGASEVFDCLRKVWFAKLGEKHGFKKDEDNEAWGGMERGNIIENNFVVPGMRIGLPKKWKFLFAGEDQETLVHGKASSTPDGLIVDLDPTQPLVIKAGGKIIRIENLDADCITLEIKSIDPRVSLEEEKAGHFGQTQMQLGIFNEKTKWRPKYSIILYINASFINDVTPFVVKFDPDVYAAGLMRADSIWPIKDPLKIYPEGKLDGACDYCRWKTACGDAVVKAIPKTEANLDPLDFQTFDTTINEYFDAKNEFAHAEKAFEIAKEAVKEAMNELGTKKVKAPTYTASWYGQPGKETVDIKAMRADGIDLTPYTQKGAPFDVLRITPKKDKDIDHE